MHCTEAHRDPELRGSAVWAQGRGARLRRPGRSHAGIALVLACGRLSDPTHLVSAQAAVSLLGRQLCCPPGSRSGFHTDAPCPVMRRLNQCQALGSRGCRMTLTTGGASPSRQGPLPPPQLLPGLQTRHPPRRPPGVQRAASTGIFPELLSPEGPAPSCPLRPVLAPWPHVTDEETEA